jgi:hypothetical protein
VCLFALDYPVFLAQHDDLMVEKMVPLVLDSIPAHHFQKQMSSLMKLSRLQFVIVGRLTSFGWTELAKPFVPADHLLEKEYHVHTSYSLIVV